MPRSRSEALAAWREAARTRIVRGGMKAMCGSADYVPATAAADVPIVSAAFRIAWLRLAGLLGVKDVVGSSALGHPFVSHIGDLAEFPFYHRRALEAELVLCAEWLADVHAPVVYDVGANVGYFATQLAQMLAGRQPTIYAFEPVAPTFAKLVRSVERLGLQDLVHPVCAAIGDRTGPVRLSYDAANSLTAQVAPQAGDEAAGARLALAAGLTLDGFLEAAPVPALVKIDVEGSEVAVLRGACHLLAAPEPPALGFEYNPVTLTDFGVTGAALRSLIEGYRLHYVDDLAGQMRPFGSPVEALAGIDWICNLFAVPRTEEAARRFDAALARAKTRLGA